MSLKSLKNAFFACLILGPLAAGAKAAECDGAITADEALKAEDARYAAQTKSDFDALERLYGDDLVYVHSTAVVDSKASYIDRQRSGLHYRVMKPSDVKVRVFGCLAIITGRGDYEVTQNGQDSSALVVHRRLGEARSKCAVCFLGIHAHSQAIRGATQLESEQSPVTKPVWSPYVDPSIMAGLDDADMPPRRSVGAIGVCELPLSRRAIIGADEPVSQTQEEVSRVSTRTL
jgi:Domain of unknown function (DUF4440)